MRTKKEVCEALFNVDFIDTQGIRRQAVKFGPEIGTSGMFLPSYFDHRLVSAVPLSARIISEYMQQLVKNSGGDFIISSADAGIYWGAVVAQPLERGFALVRKDGALAGAIPEGALIDIVDDLNTSLKTVIRGLSCLDNYNAKLNRIFVNVDRQRYNPNYLAKLKNRGYKVESAVTEQDIINWGLTHGKVTSADLELMRLAESDYEAFAVKMITENPEWVKSHRHYGDMLAYKRHIESSQIRKAIEEVLGEHLPAKTS